MVLNKFNSLSEYYGWYQLHTSESIGLVATKGCIHAGHMSLIGAARRDCDQVVVTIAIHPNQFASVEDYNRFPRPVLEDVRKLEAPHGPDVVLILSKEECQRYGAARSISIQLSPELIPGGKAHYSQRIWEGEATMMVKMVNISRPTRVYLGKKDIALSMMLKMVLRSLLYPVEVITLNSIRDEHGVVCDARLRLLGAAEQEASKAIYEALSEVVRAYLNDIFDVEVLKARARGVLKREGCIEEVFLRITNPFSLSEVSAVDPACGALVALKVLVGKEHVELTDNMILASRIPKDEESIKGIIKSMFTKRVVIVKKVPDEANSNICSIKEVA